MPIVWTQRHLGLKRAKAKLGSNLETRIYITNTDAEDRARETPAGG